MSYALAQAGLYAKRLFRYRHFWVHLALSDLRARFRRSYFGILWLALQPLLLTLIMAAVFVFIFKQTFADYSVYIFSGMVAWDFVTGCFLIGAMSFVGAESYVRQVRLPMMGYPIKAMLYCCVVFSLELTGFVIYALLVKPEIFSWRWIYLIPFFAALFAFGAPVAIISAVTNIKFRDYQQSIGIGLQMLWYLSPVFIMRSVFDHPGLKAWTDINPIAALMDLLRLPLIEGADPIVGDYALVAVWAMGLWAAALFMLVRNERKIVFYY
jgi:lipopolysaccharide transport system permease protein